MAMFDKWAAYYDQLYGQVTRDIEFYKGEAKKAKGKVLEIGCGTGRIYLELLKRGVDGYGIDSSAEMLKVLKGKARQLNLKPRVFQCNMRNYRLKEGFDLIIIPFNCFLHNLTTQHQLEALACARNHLTPEGKLIVSIFSPDPEIIARQYGREEVETHQTNQGTLKVKDRTVFVNQPDQVIEVNRTLLLNNQTIEKGKFRLALIPKREFELLLRLAGFSSWKVYGGFHYQPLESFGQDMVWIVDPPN